jgi:hypothetical protein
VAAFVYSSFVTSFIASRDLPFGFRRGGWLVRARWSIGGGGGAVVLRFLVYVCLCVCVCVVCCHLIDGPGGPVSIGQFIGIFRRFISLA